MAARKSKHGRKLVVSAPVNPNPAPLLAERPPDLNSRFRLVPANFKGINFRTRSYGNYRFSENFNRELVLVDGQFREFGDSQHWFDLDDVFYTDLTGDGSPEAIVLMTHLQCGSRCDGGKNLVYVYSQNYPMQEILKYESGSGMEGCSLKSLTIKHRRLTMELYGRCTQPGGITSEVDTDTVTVTRTEYFFNGRQLVPKPGTLLTLPDRNQVTYAVEVRINESGPVEHEL